MWRPGRAGDRLLGDAGARVADRRGADRRSIRAGPPGRDRALLFTFAASIATALAFGLVPAWQASHVDPEAALRERSRGATADRRHHRVRKLLVVTEVALAVVLLVGAGLFLRTLSSLVPRRPRIPARRDHHAWACSSACGHPRPGSRALDRILDRVESVPGVKAAGTIQFLPLRGTTCGTGFWIEEQAAARDPSRTLPTECSLVSRGYFAAMGIPVLEGTALRPAGSPHRSSRPGRQPVVREAVLSRTVACSAAAFSCRRRIRRSRRSSASSETCATTA